MGRNMGKNGRNTFLPGKNGINMVETSSTPVMDPQHVPTVNRTQAVSGLIAQINLLWSLEINNSSQLVSLSSLDWDECSIDVVLTSRLL